MDWSILFAGPVGAGNTVKAIVDRFPTEVRADVYNSKGEVTALVGPSTCTHLNDVLRGLEDVHWLTDLLPS